ncbi:hypothetical protein [Aurantiacibacter sediminis]|uniref:DUF2568 domain-containing protein n=1 Tax=Aurantiacibacter sediminis TaxID=2793064 RepID=A0ABS0N341_9SPHN|nr:hypothetical protein [Aurantiacibacter sediminis]MBH5321434.1 hypothetical protein [Aurantiacibacter sediminis]
MASLFALILTTLLGIANFVAHRAVIESGHRMVQDMTPEALRVLRPVSLSFEFLLLCGALYAVRLGHSGWMWAYLAYSLINAGAAWAIVTRRL